MDDNEDIHDDFLKALDMYYSAAAHEQLQQLEELLFDEKPVVETKKPQINYHIDSAYQGEEGYAMAVRAHMEDNPYALAFVDVRMPPGLDGVQTVRRLLSDEPNLEMVLCSAFSDYPWERINEILGYSDRVLFLRKPFDITEVRQITVALTRKWRLRMENHAATKALRRAKDDAEAASREKSSFLSNMSHEIRTPLNGVIGMADLLHQTELNGEQKEFAKGIRFSAHILLDLINNILDFSKIEAGVLNLEDISFDLHDLVRGMRTLFDHQFADQHLDFEIHIKRDVPRIVIGDPVRVRQILINLISNALKFTEEGSVQVTVSLVEEEKDTLALKFQVIDTGIGISEQGKQRLFQTFSQIDASTTRKYGGSGLGLVISKMLSRLLGGTVGVESTLGEGSTFWFTCILRRAGEGVPLAEWVHPALNKARVLLLVHHDIAKKRLEDMMASWGCEWITLSRSEDAYNRILDAQDQGRPFQIIIDELDLQRLEDTALDQAMHKHPAFADVYHIRLLEEFDDCFTFPPRTLVLRKPVSSRDLHDAISDVLFKQPNIERGERLPLILVAEDNKVNQKVVSHILKKAGFRINLAMNGEEALESFQSEIPDIVLMDCQMPRLDGYEATRRIRILEQDLGGRVPILALTANAIKGDREQCLQVGMDDYITKPIQQSVLLARIRRLLAQRGF